MFQPITALNSSTLKESGEMLTSTNKTIQNENPHMHILGTRSLKSLERILQDYLGYLIKCGPSYVTVSKTATKIAIKLKFLYFYELIIQMNYNILKKPKA